MTLSVKIKPTGGLKTMGGERMGLCFKEIPELDEIIFAVCEQLTLRNKPTQRVKGYIVKCPFPQALPL